MLVGVFLGKYAFWHVSALNWKIHSLETLPPDPFIGNWFNFSFRWESQTHQTKRNRVPLFRELESRELDRVNWNPVNWESVGGIMRRLLFCGT